MAGGPPLVLAVEHEADCPPALLGEWLAALGCAVEVRRPYLGDPVPEDLTGHDAVLVLGGSMGADDDADHDWLAPTRELIRAAARAMVPTLGTCLGHQLAAVALGGTVEPNPHGRQIGVLPVGWDPGWQSDPLLGDLRGARRALHWNRDVVTVLPEGARQLATAPDGTVQAARLAPTVWGVQWHPEVDASVVRAWADAEREGLGGDREGERAVEEVTRARRELARAWQPLAARFAQLAGGQR